MRNRAKEILRNEMSENTLEHIHKIEHLENWLIDAMINFHESEVKKLTKGDIIKNRSIK